MARDLGLTLAGGGNRAWYQLGLLERWWPELEPRLAAAATSSAGACVLTMMLSGRRLEGYGRYRALTSRLRGNLDWRRPLRGAPLFPHAEIYRETLLTSFGQGGLERIQALPFPLHVLAAEIPAGLPTQAAVALGIAAYAVEKRLRPARLHPTWGRRLGFRPFVRDARACRTPEDLAALVLASSATPPFTGVARLEGRRLLDGGLVDNAPAFVLDGRPDVLRQLVVLTRPYRPEALATARHRVYVVPSAPPLAGRWDYTRSDLIDATVLLGAEDARRYEPALRDLLGE